MLLQVAHHHEPEQEQVAHHHEQELEPLLLLLPLDAARQPEWNTLSTDDARDLLEYTKERSGMVGFLLVLESLRPPSLPSNAPRQYLAIRGRPGGHPRTSADGVPASPAYLKTNENQWKPMKI